MMQDDYATLNLLDLFLSLLCCTVVQRGVSGNKKCGLHGSVQDKGKVGGICKHGARRITGKCF